ncbi:MAG: alpha/beta hydrolase [Kiritimatiellae bacterium]|jgi:pimeloyl-ACP methyl ester carboxylesterase|nr:alpha/beta hydrolase [Kiritimatiellia bacterium]
MKPGIKKRMVIYPLIYILVGVFLFFRQRKMIYFPTAPEPHRYAEEIIENEGESIKVIVLNSGKERAIIYFGGTAEAVIYNAYEFQQDFTNHTVYLFNYRGYGDSTGNPTEKGIFSDALALYDQIKERHASISAIGRSLGSGVAIYLASQRTINRVALATPYDSILSVAQHRFMIYPLRILLLDQYNSISRVKDIKVPVLILMAENDRIIKKRHTTRLIKAFPSDQVTAKTIEDAEHNTISDYPEFHEQLKTFFNTE